MAKKSWYKQNDNLEEVLSALRFIARSHRTRIKAKRSLYSRASYKPSERVIEVDIGERDANVQWLVCAVLHEIGHSICHDKKLFWIYHSIQRDKPAFKATALKAERYVDRIAKELLSQYFPVIPYYPGYFAWYAKDNLYYCYGWSK